MQRVMKETQERLRMFEEGQRKWQEQQQSPQQMVRKRWREGGREKERASQKRKVVLQSNLVTFA